ncbi:MAG: hypothetical protein ACP5IB_06915 [Thermoplasmata archaeon]
MAEKDKEKDVKAEIIELIKAMQGQPQSDTATLEKIISAIGSSKVDPITLLVVGNMMQPKQQGIENLIQGLIAWRMAENMLEERKGNGDDIINLLKYQIVMQSMGGQKSNIDEVLKLISLMNQNPKGIEEVREALKQMQSEQQKQKEIENITKEHQKQIDEMRKTNEMTISQMKDYINQLLLQINQARSQGSGGFLEELTKVTELNNAVRQYAEMMGWGPKQGLPAAGEEWKPGDYLKAIEQIGSTVSNIVGGFASAQATRKEKRQVQPIQEVPQQPAPSPPSPAQKQNNQETPKETPPPETPPPPPVQQPPEQESIDPEIEDYINTMTETPEGLMDKYGVLYKFDENNKITLEQFKENARKYPNDVRAMIEQSKQAVQEAQAQQENEVKETEETE